jgi:endonuclease/exonuclease/phosphatase family metal-dependent hydrolase
MRTLLFVLLFSGFMLQAQDEGITRVRVMTFNILHGANTDDSFDIDRIAQVIKDANPDLVALQEVDYKTNRARQYDLVTELGWRTKMSPLFGKAMSYDGGEYGEGILSKYSFIQTRNVPLPFSPGNEPRAALEVTVALPTGDTISFIGTHLDHLYEATDRVSQVKRINEVFQANQFPTILAGDLNDRPGSQPIELLEAHWTPTYDKSNPASTYPANDPGYKIDYIMYNPTSRWKLLDRQIIQDSIASDHCAYVVTLELIK